MNNQVRSVEGWVHAVDRSETRDVNGDQASLRLAGYAALFNSPSERMGRIVETIDQRAFDGVLATAPDVRFQAEHSGLALARTTNGSLTMKVDDRGLYFEADLNPSVQASRDLYALVERGDITQMSFGFTIGDETVDDRGDTIRAHITRIDRVFELSAVTFPAYAETQVEVASERSADDQFELRDADAPDMDDLWEVEVAAARREREANG